MRTANNAHFSNYFTNRRHVVAKRPKVCDCFCTQLKSTTKFWNSIFMSINCTIKLSLRGGGGGGVWRKFCFCFRFVEFLIVFFAVLLLLFLLLLFILLRVNPFGTSANWASTKSTDWTRKKWMKCQNQNRKWSHRRTSNVKKPRGACCLAQSCGHPCIHSTSSWLANNWSECYSSSALFWLIWLT